MERRDDVGGAAIQAHVLEGLFLALHVSQTLVRVDERKEFIDDVGRHLGIGDPECTVLKGRRIVVYPAVGAGRYGQFAEVGILIIESRGFGVGIQVEHRAVAGREAPVDRDDREGAGAAGKLNGDLRVHHYHR